MLFLVPPPSIFEVDAKDVIGIASEAISALVFSRSLDFRSGPFSCLVFVALTIFVNMDDGEDSGCKDVDERTSARVSSDH